MNVNEVTVGLRYRVSGDVTNGFFNDLTPYLIHQEMVGVVKKITKSHVTLESGHRFHINDNLKIKKF